jgi:hypothetical protein
MIAITLGNRIDAVRSAALENDYVGGCEFRVWAYEISRLNEGLGASPPRQNSPPRLTNEPLVPHGLATL